MPTSLKKENLHYQKPRISNLSAGVVHRLERPLAFLENKKKKKLTASKYKTTY